MRRESPYGRVLWVGGTREALVPPETLLGPLRSKGVEWVVAATAAQALAEHGSEDFALLLLDVATSWAQGREALRALHATWGARATPLLVLCDEGGAECVREAHALGAVDWLGRRPDAEVLRAKVSVFVALHQRAEAREAPLRFLLEAGGVGHWRLELATMELEASAGCKRNFGLSPEDDLSSYARLRALIHPEDRERVGAAVERTLATREDYAAEYRVLPPGGALRWVAARGRVVSDARGLPVAMEGVTLDITERMRGAQKLAFLAEASRLLGESLEAEDVLARVARFATASLATYCLVDLVEEGMLRRVAIAHREPTQEALMRRVWGARPTRHASGLLADALHRQETTLYTDFSDERLRRASLDAEHRALIQALDPNSLLILPLRSREHTWGTIALARVGAEPPLDAHDQELLEELGRRTVVTLENTRLLRATRAAVRLRDEFLSVASHELKTPLTSLTLRLQSVGRSVGAAAGPEVVLKRLPGELEAMGQQVRRLSALMNDLLEVVHIDTQPVVLERERVDLARLVREGALRLAPEAARVGCSLEVQGVPVLEGQWDRVRLEQVVARLLSNALKYGAGHPIQLEVGTKAGQAWFQVRDAGIGIAPEALPRLFHKFERAASVRHYGGLGLGLYLARRILESHGGSIQVESTPGQGAVFTAWLPLYPAAERRTAPSETSATRPG